MSRSAGDASSGQLSGAMACGVSGKERGQRTGRGLPPAASSLKSKSLRACALEVLPASKHSSLALDFD
jgi:hypothetical protein